MIYKLNDNRSLWEFLLKIEIHDMKSRTVPKIRYSISMYFPSILKSYQFSVGILLIQLIEIIQFYNECFIDALR